MVHILIIESDTQLREAVRDVLHLAGFETIGVPKGTDGLTELSRQYLSLILCNGMLSDMNGHEVIQQVRRMPETNMIPIIFMTSFSAYAGYYGYAPYVTPRQVERNIPKGSVPLEEGAQVVSADGEAVGSVKRIFTDTKTDRVTHFVVSEGLIFKEKRLIPTAWVKNIKEDEVELSVDAKVVERLREYED